MKKHQTDIIFETESNSYDNVFHEMFFSKHAPVSVFKLDKVLSNLESYIKSLFEVELTVPFSGMIQITSLQYADSGDFDSKNFVEGVETIKVENAKTIADILVQSLKNEDNLCWVDNYKYLGDGKLLIFINEHENDFIRFNEPLFNELVKDGYSIEFYNNELIEFHKNNYIFKIETYSYEPLMIILNYFHEELETLIEKEVRDEIIKFIPGLSNWNCIPAFFNSKTFSLIANFDWGWINKDSKIINRFDGDYLSAKAIKYLSSLRKQVKYEINLKDNQLEKLVIEINKEENNIYGESYSIEQDFLTSDDLIKTPNGFKGFKFQQILIKANEEGDSIGSIFIWHYYISESIVSIEYSIAKTTQELISKIPIEIM